MINREINTNYLFTSEAVAEGHSDKIADQISDAILDALLREDVESRVACEVMVAKNTIVIAGEITSKARIDYVAVAREVLKDVGCTYQNSGLDPEICKVIILLNRQSLDIAQGVNIGKGLYWEQGAGDQGSVFGYACSETNVLMPIGVFYSHEIMKRLAEVRRMKSIAWLQPDGKVQLTIEYNSKGVPLRVHTMVLSVQHTIEVTHDEIKRDMISLVKSVVPKELLDDKTIYYVNPTGRFVQGGASSDCGLTGRKIIVDTYGGVSRHGGGAFSGKDPSKVDRSGAYMARYLAKSIVTWGLAERCEVQLSYGIGIAEPVAIFVDTFNTGVVSDNKIVDIIKYYYNLTPMGIIDFLGLKSPIYRQTSTYGHFGRKDFPWENIRPLENLK